MAFTYCTNCGEKIDDSCQFCPHCGHRKGQQRSGYSYGAEGFGGDQRPPENGYSSPEGAQNGNPDGTEFGQEGYRRPYRTPDQNPYGQNPYGQNPYGQNPYGQRPYNNGSPYGQNPYGQNPYGAPVTPKRPVSIPLVILSIINIVFGCCTTFSMIIGIIALVKTLGAQNATDDMKEQDDKRTALILNIVGIILTAITMAAFMVLMLTMPEEIAALLLI